MTKEEFLPFIQKEGKRCLVVILSSIVLSIGIAWFIDAAGLYSGGIPGISQIIRTVFSRFFQIELNIGLLTFILNIPLLILGWFGVGRKFTIYSGISVVIQSLFLGVIPHAQFDLDILTRALIGGMLLGIGTGLALRFGTSTGGVDIISQYLSFKKGTTVGFIGLTINLCITVLAGLLNRWEIAFYTAIRLIITTIFIDKIHTAYNYLSVDIITDTEDIASEVMTKMGRGMTIIHGEGAYTHHNKVVLYCIISSYELVTLQEIIKEYDQKAFVVVKPVMRIIGNFIRNVIN